MTPEPELCGANNIVLKVHLLASHSILSAVTECIRCCFVDQEEKENVLGPTMASIHSLQTVKYLILL
jgi:hypothetical protein